MYPNYYKSSKKVSAKAVAIRSYKAGIDIQKILKNARSAVDFQAIGEGFSGVFTEIQGWVNKHGEALGRAAFGDLKEKLAELNKATEEYRQVLLKYQAEPASTPGLFDDVSHAADRFFLSKAQYQAARSELVAKGFVVAGLIAFILSMVTIVYSSLNKMGPNITQSIRDAEGLIEYLKELAKLYSVDPNRRGIGQEVIDIREDVNVYARVETRKLLDPMKNIFPDDYNRIMDVVDQIDEVSYSFREDVPEQTNRALMSMISLLEKLIDELATFQDKVSELERDDLSKKVEKRLM